MDIVTIFIISVIIVIIVILISTIFRRSYVEKRTTSHKYNFVSPADEAFQPHTLIS